MFQNLTNLSFRRNGKQAVGFYLAYFLLGLIMGAIGGAVSGTLSGASTFDEGYQSGLKAGPIVSIIYCLTISLLILRYKRLYKNFGYILLVFCSPILAVFGGALLGLIIPAFLTTREKT